jgi:hypothetical protein
MNAAQVASVPGEFIVGFKKEFRIPAAGEQLAVSKGGKILKELTHPALNAILVRVPLQQADAFQRAMKESPLVRYVEPNLIVSTTIVPNDPRYRDQWAPPKIRAPQAWDINTGSSSVRVGVLDTGVDYTHEDIAPNYLACGYDWVNSDTDPMDDHNDPVTGNSHGTHVAGIIAARTNNGIGVAGVAGGWGTSHGVTLIAEKVMDSTGSGDTSTLALAITHAVDVCGVDIISMSLGWYDFFSYIVQSALQFAADRGVISVAAAGNENRDNSSFYPCAYGSGHPLSTAEIVMCVSATDSSDSRASFSDYGNPVDISAPGVNILSTVRRGFGDYGYKSGTSMATPHVSAAVALVMTQFPSYTRDQVWNDLLAGADDLGATGWDAYFGWGRLNGYIPLLGKLNVALIAPMNGAIVTTSPVTFRVRVTDFAETPVQGADVVVYVNHPHLYITYFCTSSAKSDSNGYFSCDITFADSGTYSWYATASKSGYESSTSQTWAFIYSPPTVTLSPTNGRAGTNVLVSGLGFDSSDTSCTISSSPSGLISNPQCTLASGIVSGSFTVASDALGSYTVVVTGSPAGDVGTAPFMTNSFFHAATEFWFSRYDMLNAEWDAIHIVNVGTGTASIEITIGSGISDSFTLDAGQQTYRTYQGYAGGPVHIVSTQTIWATQRILGWTAMQEIYGMPGDVASKDIIFTWYDLANAQSDDVYVINPSTSQTASVDLYVAGVPRGHLDINPGQEAVTSFPGVIGGPLRISSSVPVFASQRVIGFGDFAEIIGLPSWYTSTETWFNWYDMQGASWDAIHMLNPGTSIANVQIYVGGTLRDSLSLAPGAADYRTFPGLVGGPVRIVSTQPIWVTQRIIGWGGWKEVFGVPTALATTDWYFTWYDMKYAQWNAIHIINPSASDAQVEVYVGGQLLSTLTVHAGEASYVTYPGLITGPVRVISDVPIMMSQRILGWQSFEETIGASLAT